MNTPLEMISRLSEEVPAEPYRTSLLNASGILEWYQLHTEIDKENDFNVLRPDFPRLVHCRASIDGKVFPYDKHPSTLRSLAKAAGIVKGHNVTVSKDFEQVSRELYIQCGLISSDPELRAYFHQFWLEGTVKVDDTTFEFTPQMSSIRAEIGRCDGIIGIIGKNRVSFTARPHLGEVKSTGDPAGQWEGQQPLPIVDFEESDEQNMIRVLQAIISNTSTPQ